MKVLILAYEFPPLISIGGSRPYFWLKHWGAQGAEVAVVTRHWSADVNSSEDYVRPTNPDRTITQPTPKTRVICTPFKPNLRDSLLLKYGFYGLQLPRKILSLLYSYLEWFSYFFDAKSEIYFESDRLLSKEKFDVIVATGQPFILFRYASELAKKYNIPWVADYRDGWTSSQGDYTLRGLQKIQHGFLRKQELKIVETAAFITTAAPPYRDELLKLFPHKNIEVVYNGFDEEILEQIKDVPARKDKFVIAYAGMMYGHQKLETFLKAVENLLLSGELKEEDIEIVFFAANAFPDSKNRILSFSKIVNNVILTTDRVPYSTLLKKLKESHLLLLLSRKNANWLNTKLFDYFAANRPVLLVESDRGILDELIHQSSAGYTAQNELEAMAAILKEYENFKTNRANNREINPYSMQFNRKTQSVFYYNILNQKIRKEGE